MKPILLFFLYSLLYALPATAQTPDSTNRWFFENASYAVQSRFLTEEEYTEGRIGFGNTTRILYRVPVGNRISLASGLGVAVQQLRQRSTFDRYLCEIAPLPCRVLVADHVIANYTSFSLEIPFQARVHLSPHRRGLYLLGAAALQIPLVRDQDLYSVSNNGNENLLPDEQVQYRTTAYWSSGIGYQLPASDRFAWYLELAASWSMSTVLQDAGLTGELGRRNYFRSADVRQLGLTGGLNF